MQSNSEDSLVLLLTKQLLQLLCFGICSALVMLQQATLIHVSILSFLHINLHKACKITQTNVRTMDENHLGAVFEDQVSDSTVGQCDTHQVLTLQRQNLHK